METINYLVCGSPLSSVKVAIIEALPKHCNDSTMNFYDSKRSALNIDSKMKIRKASRLKLRIALKLESLYPIGY